jgi:hypothetical protein
LALVGARYKFTVVDIGSFGRNINGGIFARSKLGKYLETHLCIPEDKQFPGTLCLAPHHSSENLLNETLHRIAKQRGQ